MICIILSFYIAQIVVQRIKKICSLIFKVNNPPLGDFPHCGHPGPELKLVKSFRAIELIPSVILLLQKLPLQRNGEVTSAW
jgi:hypothetical protein